ncbi:YqaJ viral recombinase family protein [Corynebacterium diphtheriae bv. mitis]|nr:YqaJ viral recombinase family protein [Corynebacterium diphtheriae bv. mitis]
MTTETAYLQAVQLRFLEWLLHRIAEDPALADLAGVVDALEDQADAIRRKANTILGGKSMYYQPLIHQPITKDRVKEAVESRKVTHLADTDGRLYPLMGWVNEKTISVQRGETIKRIPFEDVTSLGVKTTKTVDDFTYSALRLYARTGEKNLPKAGIQHLKEEGLIDHEGLTELGHRTLKEKTWGEIIQNPPAPGTPEWRKMITASKIPAILGISRYKSQFALWHEMAGNIEPTPMDPRRAAWGHAAELAIAQQWATVNPEWKLNPMRGGTCELAYTTDHGFPTLATIDRRAYCRGTFHIIECKTARDLSDWGREGGAGRGPCRLPSAGDVADGTVRYPRGDDRCPRLR